MPLPKPRKNEKKKDWLNRCMGNDMMVSEFSDEKQRYAICNQIWRDKDKKKSLEENQTMPAKKDDIERREFPLSDFRIQKKDDEPMRFKGIAVPFDSLSEDLGGFKERVAPGAFSNTIKKDDIRMLFNHNRDYVLGRTRSNTLTLEENEKGLKIENEPPDTQWARDLAISVERKDIDKMSFGFRTIKDSWNEEGKIPIRTLEEVKLLDVSIVTFPAYHQTKVQTRDNMAKDGINLDTISRVWVKSQHGLEITEEDRIEIDATISCLKNILPEGAETGTGKDAQQTPRLKFLKLDLDNKEKNIGGIKDA